MPIKKNDLIIVGFKGFGKEVYFLASRLGLNVRGFLDDDPDVVGESYFGIPMLGNVSDWAKYSDCDFVIAIGNPRIRKKVYNKMRQSGVPSFASLIDPSVIVDANHVSIGEGSIVCAGTICTVDIKIGKHVIVNLNCTVGHEVVIQDFATIAPMVALSGNVHVRSGVEIGTGSAIRQGLDISFGSMVGMGSVVTKNVSDNIVVFGSPAKPVKTISDQWSEFGE